MEPTTIARVATAAAKFLFTSDESGESGIHKLVIGIAYGIVGFLLLYNIAVELYVLPVNFLTELFMPESIREAKRTLEQDFGRPIIQTGQEGLLPLPVTDSRVSSMYGWRYVDIMGGINFHEWIDFHVEFGTSVMAVAPGKVYDCGVSKDYGEFILLEHRMIRYDKDDEIIEIETFYSLYAHLYKQYVFREQVIEQGREIALSGGDPKLHFSGNSTGAHLHLELRRTPEYASHFNPYDYILDPNPFRGKTKSIGWLPF